MTAREFTTGLVTRLKTEGYAPWRVGCGMFGVESVRVVIRQGVRGSSKKPSAVIENGAERVEMGWSEPAILARIRQWAPRPGQE